VSKRKLHRNFRAQAAQKHASEIVDISDLISSKNLFKRVFKDISC
jgi:hypothetical protein